jgi:broad specificity phosphatase PhoE
VTEQDTKPVNYQVTLLRHAESIGNAEGYYQGQSDFPLTETGTMQARLLCEYWLVKKAGFDRIISSPLARARQTAEILAHALALPLVLDPLWMERNAGLLEGLQEKEAEIRYPKPDFVHIYQPIGKTGESQWQLYLRAGNAVQKIIDQPPGNYLVVSHGALLNMVLYTVLGIVPQANFQGPHFYFSNAGFASLTYYPQLHNWVLENLVDLQLWTASNSNQL